MKVGDLVKYHRAGRPPKIGIVSDIDEFPSTDNLITYYFVEFADKAMKLREDHLEVINENR